MHRTSLNNILIQNLTLLEEMSSLTDTQTIKKILVAAVVGIQHIQLILEEVLIEEGHHNVRLFSAACLLRKRVPYFDQARAWATHLMAVDIYRKREFEA